MVHYTFANYITGALFSYLALLHPAALLLRFVFHMGKQTYQVN